MKFSEFIKEQGLIKEAPLPDEWDHGVFNGKQSFAKMIKYATEQAAKIGTGSARVAFEIEYEGRPTILKIAKNAKGLSQNEEECQLLFDHYLQSTGIIIPGIDYDEVNDPPRWIHMEKADKIKEADIKAETGVGFEDLVIYCRGTANGGDFRGVGGISSVLINMYNRKFDKILESGKVDDESEVVQGLIDLFGNYSHIMFQDFTVKGNWGLYKGSPVIIDIGYTEDVYKLHYEYKPKPVARW